MVLALALARANAGNNREARIAMIAMTTSNSMSVKPGNGPGVQIACVLPLTHLFFAVRRRFIRIADVCFKDDESSDRRRRLKSGDLRIGFSGGTKLGGLKMVQCQ